MAFVRTCRRCGENHLEVFHSHEYCANCNYGFCFVGTKRESAIQRSNPSKLDRKSTKLQELGFVESIFIINLIPGGA